MPNAYNASNVLEGPAIFQWNAMTLGHTSGGIEFSYKPASRLQNVDLWGKSGVNAIHQGDEIKIKVPLAEWTAASLQESFGAGNDATGSGSGAYIGMGRTAGFRYVPGSVTVIPVLTADAAKKILLYRAVPLGEIKLPFQADKDRIFETEFTGLIDETKNDGELIGKVYLN